MVERPSCQPAEHEIDDGMDNLVRAEWYSKLQMEVRDGGKDIDQDNPQDGGKLIFQEIPQTASTLLIACGS